MEDFEIRRGGLTERNALVIREVANPWPPVEAEAPGILLSGQAARCSRAFGKPPWRASPGILSRVISRPGPQARHKFVINTLGWDRNAAEGTGHATVKRSPPTPCSSPRRQNLPTRLSLQLPQDRDYNSQEAARRTEQRPSQNAAQWRPHPSFSFLRSSYFSTRRHPGGQEVGCGRALRASACRVRRWEEDGAGSWGRMGGRRGGERGGEGK